MSNRKCSALWLQDQLFLIKEQLKDTRLKNELTISSYQDEVLKLKSTIKKQDEEINSLNEKLLSLDSNKIKDTVLAVATNDYESKIKELYLEIDRIRDQYNNLHYENAILKCRYESREAEFFRSLDKVKLENLVEVEQLQNKVTNYEKQKSLPSDSYAVELNSKKREVLELNTKVKFLLSECDELRARNENLTLQINGLMRTNSKQAADYTNNLRTIESEKTRIMRQLEICEKELSNYQEHRKSLNVQLQTSKQEILSLQAKVAENEHNAQMVVSNFRDELERLKSEYESEREQLIDEIKRLRSELNSLDESSSHERHTLLASEQEIKQNLINARQQFWKLSNEVQLEREKLEKKVRELENDKNSHVKQLSHENELLEERLRTCTLSKLELEKEIVTLRQHIENETKNFNRCVNELPLTDSLNYQKEIQDLKDKFQVLAASCSREVEQKNTSNKRTGQTEKDNEILEMKLTWEQQKLHFQQRLDELESQLRECRSTSTSEKRELEFKFKQSTELVSKLKEKLDSQKEKLHSQKDVLEKCVPTEIHLQVKNQLFELQRRLEEYRKLITADPGNLSKQSASVQSSKMLTDIKNTGFKIFPQEALYNKGAIISAETKKEIDKVTSKKKAMLNRRRPSKTKEKNSYPKSLSPVLSSSSDIDWENL